MKVWNVVCPICSFKKKSTDMTQRWDGLWVCEKDWEPRHPLDFVRARIEDTSVPYSYPEKEGTSTNTSTWANTLTTVTPPPTDTIED